jgi:hypothetical protein
MDGLVWVNEMSDKAPLLQGLNNMNHDSARTK